MIKIIGKTTDDKPVINGLFSLYETEGIPLEIILQQVNQRGLVPCWISFYKEAKAAGMSHNRILSKLEPAIIDSFGLVWANHVTDSLNSLHDQHKL